ncbi:MAG: hypothetical protein AVDCRST_MAG42-1218 [uncultured Chthoniobacterales bacterium]|uniref:Uncharacterized protein n=1 Tax=uncultured Chthoniobacterales bacterium TaxID=1836801 RepID=A0A6J4HTT3_9BACT|nr:MAG: hypothetical protein AVDCRST_MAG42-1218 [uncultured Chthoniobacterales bacterium]
MSSRRARLSAVGKCSTSATRDARGHPEPRRRRRTSRRPARFDRPTAQAKHLA